MTAKTMSANVKTKPTGVFEKYWGLRIEGAKARLNAALEIIRKHNPTRGTLAETTLRDLLAEFLPDRWGIGGGFILKPDGSVSNQVDILIYDKAKDSPIYRDGALLVLSPGMARVAIEVKSNFDGDEVADSFENLASVKRNDANCQCVVFGFRGATSKTLKKHMRKTLRDQRKAGTFDAGRLPDAVYVLERDIVISRSVKNGSVLAGYEAGDPVIRHLFTRVLSELKLTNLQAFVDKDDLGKEVFTI